MIKIDNSWSLFLDRDGVINVERNNDYVYTADQFVFHDSVLEVLKKSSEIFYKILVVTNQRGIGRGLMTHNDLGDVHNFMLKEIVEHGGRIDRVYYAPDRYDESPDRKPNTGMAHQAKADFEKIDFEKSIMIGNNMSDMEFGKRMGMTTIFVCTTQQQEATHEMIDYTIPDLSHLFSVVELTTD